MITYIFLILAVFFGTASNIFAKEAEGFTNLAPSIASAIAIILCMFFLSQVMKTIFGLVLIIFGVSLVNLFGKN